MILLFAPNMPQADWWCRCMNDPPISPRNTREIAILTPSSGNSQAVRGRRLVSGEDRVIIYNSIYVYNHGTVKEQRRWHHLMLILRRLEYSSPEWSESSREYMEPADES